MYRQAFHQSPVRGGPDDLLLIAGRGFSADDTVVYRAVEDATEPNTPSGIPKESTSEAGVAKLVSTNNIPDSLTVLLPDSVREDRTYALWVHTAAGEWSKPVKINDARLLWVSPAFVYASASVAGLPRSVKIVGRNLQKRAGQPLRVRLTGPQTIDAVAVETSSTALDNYVARVDLSKKLVPGRYRAAVSRDGLRWIPLADQLIEVRPDPVRPAEFQVSDAAFGACRADDGKDDTACVIRAIGAAQRAGGGTVAFGPGNWDLIDQNQNLVGSDGIVVPNKVELSGTGPANTQISRHSQWNEKLKPAFTLSGENAIRGLNFRDLQVFNSIKQAGPFLRLGPANPALPAQPVSDVVITGNTFDRTLIAIADSGSPIRRLFITYNEFGAFHEGIRLDGNRFNAAYAFDVEDAVIVGNVFKPGSLLDVKKRLGSVASEIGAGHRVDFSDNTADGAATEYLYSPEDSRGWRAAFFWHMNGNQEKLLVANNTATCTGDKDGDGEGISYDNNGNTFGFDMAQDVVAASPNSLTVAGAPLPRQSGNPVPLDSYYVGHWIQVGAGPGVGQVRKIKAYRIDGKTNRTIFTVSPEWDVLPIAGSSRISVGREFWQVYTVANTIDHRRPLCQKSNRTEPKGGIIAVWAQMADSVIDGNRQFDTDGILFHNQFSERTPNCPECDRGPHYVSFLEIRGNLIDGEYDWTTGCSSSGIQGSLAASPGRPPPTVNYGTTIAHNKIRSADGQSGGAIALTPGWYTGPAPHRWPLVDNILIHHNQIDGFWASPARSCRNEKSKQRTGINLREASLVHDAVVYANTCGKIPEKIASRSTERITKLCKPQTQGLCECNEGGTP